MKNFYFSALFLFLMIIVSTKIFGDSDSDNISFVSSDNSIETNLNACQASVDYLDSFESFPQPNLDPCWTKYPTAISTYYYVKTDGLAHSGNNGVRMRINNTGDAYLISPELIDFDATKRISFWMQSGAYYNVTIGTITNPNDVSTYEEYAQLTVQTEDGGQWREFHVDFSDYTGITSNVAFKLSGGYAIIAIDDFVHEESPSCLEPINLSSVSYGFEAELDWTDLNTPTSWDIEYGPVGFEQGTGSLINTTTKPAIISNLNAESNYEFYVKSHCSPTDESGWSRNTRFSTTCEPRTVGYNYTFDDDYPTEFYSCWSEFGYTSLPQGGSEPSSVKMLELRNYNGAGAIVITPELANLSNNNRIKFWVYNENSFSGLSVGTIHDPTNEATYSEIQNFDAAQLPSNQWIQLIVNFDSYTGSDRFVAIKQLSSESNSKIFIDSFTYQDIPSCLEPTDFQVTNLADTEIDIQWMELGSANAWEIQYGESGFELGTGISINSSTSSLTINNLVADTKYDMYLRAVCSVSDKSDWIPLYEITTACGPLTEAYTQTFDASQMANCWTTIPAVATGAINAEEVTVSTSYRVFDTGYSVRFADYTFADHLFLISPELSDLGSASNRIKFWLHPRYSDANLIVGTMSNPNDAATFTPHTTILSTDMVYREWKQFVINFDDYTGNDRYIAFQMQLLGDSSSIYEFLYLDQFEYSSIPACQAPIQLSNDFVSNGDITLSWQDSNGATQWEIEYGPTGFWQSQGTILEANSNPFILSGLTLDTSYDIYVRSICNGNEYSDWTSKLVVNLGCGESYSVGYAHDFNTAILDGCWTAYEYPTNSSSTSFAMSTVNNNGASGYSAYLTDTSYSSTNRTILVSPIFTDLSIDKKIEFYISNYTGGLSVGTLSDPNDGSSFQLLQSITGNVASGTWEKRTVYLTNYNGNDSHIAFVQQRSLGTGNQVYIDDFQYLQSVICNTPTDFSVDDASDTTVSISWTGSGVESQWELEYQQIGVTNSNVTSFVNSEIHTFQNLLEGTEYSVKVRAKCDDDSLYSEWSETLLFSTTCTPVSANYFESFEFENELSPCWTKIIQTTDPFVSINVINAYEANYSSTWIGSIFYQVLPVTGNQFLKFRNYYNSSASDIILVSRSISDLDANKRIRFNLISNRGSSSGSSYNQSSLYIGTMSDPNDANTFNLIQTITPQEMNEFKTDGLPMVDWKEHTIYLNNYIGTDNYVAIKHDAEFSGNEFFLDDFKYEAIPTCVEPLYPEVLDERYDAVDVTWQTYENSAPLSWEIQYGPQGFILGTGVSVVSASNPFTISNLQADSTYDFYVRANCGGSYSDWSVKQKFKTKCIGFEVGYLENFDSQSEGQVESCWTAIRPTGTGASYWDESYNNLAVVDNVSPNAYTAHSGPNCVRHFNEVSHPYHSAVSDQIVLVSPRLIGLDNYKKIKFWINPVPSAYATPSEIIIGTLSDPDDYTTFTPYYTITDAYEHENTWTQYEIDLSDYYLEDEYIGIKQAAINQRQEVLIDDFEYIENDCVTPTALRATQNGTGSVELGWQDNNTLQAPESWEIQYGFKGFELGSGTIVPASTNPFVISGLSNFSEYDFYVRSYCNVQDGYSNWSNPYSFNITCVVSAPFYENFDQYNAAAQNYTTGIPGFCWTRNDRSVSGILNTNTFVVSPSSLPNVGFVNFYDSDQSPVSGIMVSPYLSDFDSNKLLKIWVRNETTGSDYNKSGLIIGTMTNPLDSATFVPFTTIQADEVPRFGREFLIDFASYTGDAHHIAIKHDEANDYSLVIFDDLYYDDKPACLEPINIGFMGVSDTNVTLSWQNLGTATAFEVQYGVQGFSIGTGMTATTTGNSIIINNLNPESNYDFYVRAVCASNTYSEWIGPKHATTACNVVSVPWIENFDNMTSYGQGILPECFQNDEVWVSSNTNLSQYQQGDGDTEYLYATFDEYGIVAYIITPMFSLQAGTTYHLNFKIRKEQGDYSFQSVQIWTGQGNTPQALDNYINYFSEFSFGFYDYYPIETIFTPVVSGDYSFLLDFGYSSIVHTISIDSFSLDGDYDLPIPIPNNSIVSFDFQGSIPASIILEQTENTICTSYTDAGESVVLMSGGENRSTWYETGSNSLNWSQNQNHISKVNFELDASNVSELFMNFDLKQTFDTVNSESLFRVVANGTILETFVSNGNFSYQPIEIDLSAYAGGDVRISLQHLGRFRGDGSNSGDKAYLDNLSFGEESSLSISEQNFYGLSYYPNPVKNQFYLKNTLAMDKIEVLDLLGRKIQSYKNLGTTAILDVSDLPSALYLVEVYVGNAKKTLKILKN